MFRTAGHNIIYSITVHNITLDRLFSFKVKWHKELPNWLYQEYSIVVGFPKEVLQKRSQLERKWLEQSKKPLPPLPHAKEFVPKMGLLKLSNYRKLPRAKFWTSWPKRTFEQALPSKSWVSSSRLKELAIKYKYNDWANLEKVCKRLDMGADIGCTGRARQSTISTNANSAYSYGDRVCDALAEMIKDGIMVGPLDEEEIPWKDISVSPIMVRLKPTGKARIIINLSHPKTEVGPSGINSGIDIKNFPAKMSSTRRFVESLFKVGRNALICKSDWNQAYKHQFVREEDLKLQFVKFMGKYFCELALVFGAGSSPGIYTDLASVPLHIAIKKSGIRRDLVGMHLDDVVAVGVSNSESIHKFDQAYREVAEYVGISLADRTDADKSFAPTTRGQVLGVDYNTEDWTWSIRQDKLIRIMHMIKEALDSENISVGHMKSLVGKILYVRFLVPGSKYKLGYLNHAAAGKDKAKMIHLSDPCKEHLYWWFIMLPICAEWSPIVRPEPTLSPMAIPAYTDAAGGSYKIGHGLGGILGKDWFYVPWPQWLNMGHRNFDGIKFDRKMCVLEMLGPLAILTIKPNRIRNKDVEVFVDNSGAVSILAKGYSSSCIYSYTVAMAINEVAEALNCNLVATKVPRCSDRNTIIADAISKADWKTLDEFMWWRNIEPCRIPIALLRWINDPREDLNLGKKILREMAQYTMLLGYNC